MGNQNDKELVDMTNNILQNANNTIDILTSESLRITSSILHDKYGLSNRINKFSFEEKYVRWVSSFIDIKKITLEDLKKFIEEIKNNEDVHIVIRHIFGSRDVLDNPTKIGSFYFFKNETEFKTLFPQTQLYSPEFIKYLNIDGEKVAYCCKSIDPLTAKKNAIEKFTNLENILNCNVWLSDIPCIYSIVNRRDLETEQERTISSNGTISTSFSLNIQPYSLKEDLNSDITKKLIKICDGGSELEKRILMAANWLGISVREGYTASSFLHCVMAIEAIVESEGKGLIYPSITSQIRDSVIFTFYDLSPSEKKEMYKKINKMYENRSKIAHGDYCQLPHDDHDFAHRLAIKLITKLLSDKEYKEISFETFQNIIKKRKYGFE